MSNASIYTRHPTYRAKLQTQDSKSRNYHGTHSTVDEPDLNGGESCPMPGSSKTKTPAEINDANRRRYGQRSRDVVLTAEPFRGNSNSAMASGVKNTLDPGRVWSGDSEKAREATASINDLPPNVAEMAFADLAAGESLESVYNRYVGGGLFECAADGSSYTRAVRGSTQDNLSTRDRMDRDSYDAIDRIKAYQKRGIRNPL